MSMVDFRNEWNILRQEQTLAESIESELQEANAIASASNHKYEDVNRRLKGKSKVEKYLPTKL